MAGFAKKLIIGMMIAGCGFPAAVAAGGDLYVHIDEHGAYHFTDTPMSTKYIKARTFNNIRTTPVSGGQYKGLITDIAEKFGVRPELVQAVIHVESGFDPEAVSEKGARGLMQMMPVHLHHAGMEDPFDPGQNITAGTRYLSRLLERYDGDLNLSLAAYNAGPTAVDHYGGVPPYVETRQYVQKVLLYYRHYRKARQ